MALENILNFEEISERLNTIQTACEDTKSSLNAMDNEIKNSVGADGAAWSGNAAEQFRTSWDELAEELPTFITYVNNQAKNIEMMLSKTKVNDENGIVQ